jgi:hypothetical protein
MAPAPPAPPQQPLPALPPGDLTLKEFVLQKPAIPTAVQVNCELATYYNWAFQRCAETHYSFKLESRAPAFTQVYAYAPKESDHGRRLYESLKNGTKTKATLRIQRLGPNGQPLPGLHDQCFALIGIVE